MAVYYKFKSARDYDSIPMDGPFISVGILKDKIFESKHLGSGKDFDLVVTNAQTNEEYLDEAKLIPKNTSVLIRRVPGRPRLPIVTEQNSWLLCRSRTDNEPEDTQPIKHDYPSDSSAMNPEDVEWDEFGTDLYSIPEALPAQSSNLIQDAPAATNDDEESKIRALIDTPALDWKRKGPDGVGAGRGFGRGLAGRMGGHGRVALERKTPPPGYVCHRCRIPGHFIQHCPTNGDPNYDIKRVKPPPTGIPKSMLMATPDGSYALPSGAVAVLKPNEDAFEKAIEGLPSTRSIGELPPELHCPLCKEVMKDAVLTSKCCFKSFCDTCIRNYIISKSMCVCGATDVLADDLLPNKTLRDTINRILESGTDSADNARSAFQVQDMESARNPPPKFPSPCTSAASKERDRVSTGVEETKIEAAEKQTKPTNAPESTNDEAKSAKKLDASQAESLSVREATSRGSAPVAEEEVQQKLNPDEQGKKKKKKKVRAATPGLQWSGLQDLSADHMMPMAPYAFNPLWASGQPGADVFMGPYPGLMPYMGYGPGPLDMPFGGVIPPAPGPFGPPGLMFPPIPPHRDLAELGRGMMNMPPPVMSREEFEARKANLRRKREMERRGERGLSRDGGHPREACVNSEGPSSMRSKSVTKRAQRSSSGDHHHHQHGTERSSAERSPKPPSKRKSEHRHHHYDSDHQREPERTKSRDHKRPREHEREKSRDRDRHHRSSAETTTAGGKKQKNSVFSRISFPYGEKPPKVTPEAASDGEDEDEDRHFKRRPSRYNPL
ncbi:PREDICTED: E3 ubiquitin-protein ligase RBBP6-like isoform X2 [Tarenaya hassleriana]|uniref:E3 ubiquitin-protein ligase RBBP6-like isoform X2 n=1 Tax=Tarenaya hassleriana TaxID=28532 RepID=UPI00053C24DF|nr:PREDICTED: E3 ubiquitin-protein ligase RBBP6-like isoform X2 [Tarenaya hassleriana]